MSAGKLYVHITSFIQALSEHYYLSFTGPFCAIYLSQDNLRSNVRRDSVDHNDVIVGNLELTTA